MNFLDSWKRVIRYGIVGSASLVVVAAISALPMIAPWLPPPVATGAGVAIGGIVNFLGHRHFTFEATRPLRSSLPRYCVLIFLNAILAAATVAMLNSYFGVSLVVSNIVSFALITITAYLVLPKFVV